MSSWLNCFNKSVVRYSFIVNLSIHRHVWLKRPQRFTRRTTAATRRTTAATQHTTTPIMHIPSSRAYSPPSRYRPQPASSPKPARNPLSFTFLLFHPGRAHASRSLCCRFGCRIVIVRFLRRLLRRGSCRNVGGAPAWGARCRQSRLRRRTQERAVRTAGRATSAAAAVLLSRMPIGGRRPPPGQP